MNDILVFSQQVPDTTFLRATKPNTKSINKKSGYALPLLLSSEVVPVIFDRYIKNADYARISPSNVFYNLNPAHWTWDDDGFQTNQAAHPYHGSIFFNCFRSNNYSFWQSAPAVCAGSYLWETFAENQAPAPNDFINTSFGGIVLGEVAHRISGRFLENKTGNIGYKIKAALSFCLNPADGFSRLINKKQYSITNTGKTDSTKMQAEFDVGIRKFNINRTNPFKEKNYRLYSRLRLDYGTRGKNLKEPFGNFSLVAEIGSDDSSFMNVVSVYGSLTGWELFSSKTTSFVTISANYDYYRNQSFFYSGQSIKANIFTSSKMYRKVRLNNSLGAGVVLLAAVPNVHAFKGRDYDYGPGISIDGSSKLFIGEKLSVGINYRGGWMRTVSGNSSSYFVHALTQDIDIKIFRALSISCQTGYFNLHGIFKNFLAMDKIYPYIRIAFRYAVCL